MVQLFEKGNYSCQKLINRILKKKLLSEQRVMEKNLLHSRIRVTSSNFSKENQILKTQALMFKEIFTDDQKFLNKGEVVKKCFNKVFKKEELWKLLNLLILTKTGKF